ncbi:OLC1v1023818C1 [Oldenlandia corymbosa var. corymbosa]|uniref:OLC1v1023818C1 n=1 Tax=Oldenlandia corymbosa var. corymbosa TaxID=529605 RepID=A0AAV1C1R5_OLDCO|nr:OLC1v1023818C1 [Oldenlandia corymbosa var. corymbosa]
MASDDSQNFPSTSSFWHPENHKYDMNSKIMLTAIISLSVVVILVSMLHIYARCVLRRQARRRAALRQLRIIATAHYQYGDQIQQPNSGLDPSIIDSLPKFIIKRDRELKDVETGELTTAGTECSVCLSLLEDGEIARKLPNCGHVFHSECIDTWLNSQSTCPICRTGVEPRPGSLAVIPEPREGAVGVPVIPIGPSECGANLEGTSGVGGSARINGSSSFRLSSFRSILSWDRDRSSKRIQHTGIGQEDCSVDLERQ